MGSLLTYDTALQVVAGTTQQDLFLNLSLLGRHFSRFLLFAGVEATEERGAEKVGGGGGGKAEAGTGMAHGKSRTSCRSIDDTKEKDGGSGKRRDGGCPQGQWAKVDNQWLENSREKGRKRRVIEYQKELKILLIEVFCRSVSSLTAHVKNKPCLLRHHINNEVS